MTYDPLDAQYVEQFPRLEEAAALLRASLERIFSGQEEVVLIEARAKAPSSFLRKAAKTIDAGTPKYAVPLTDIQDQLGCRVVVRSPRDVRPIIARAQVDFNAIEDQPRPARLDPSSFGYEAWHVIFLLPQPLRQRLRLATEVFELQVSTPFQYAWAVMEHDLIYKPGQQEPTYDQKRAVHAAAALAYAADQLFEFAQDDTRRPQPEAGPPPTSPSG